MSSNTAREAAFQHLAANKLKAAAAVLERHITESNNNDKDAPGYVIDTYELDTALRKGMERLEHLREIRATTEECRIKAAVPTTAVNREFREQSTWWLPQQDLPKSWFPAPPNVTVKTATGPRAPRPVSPKHPPPSTPLTAPRGRPSSAVLRAHGVTDVDVAMALGEAAAGLAQQQAAILVAAAAASGGGSGAEQSPRQHSRGPASPHRNPRGSYNGAFSGSGSSFRNVTPGDGGATSQVTAGGGSVRVAWSLPSRRGASSGGLDIPPGTPVLYDGGGDAAVPGTGPAGPMVAPPGYPRYTLNLFQMKQQQLQALQQHGAASAGAHPNGSDSAPLFIQPIQSDDEDAEEEEQSENADDDANAVSDGDGGYGASDGIVLGTGFRALADEEPQSKHQNVALSTSIQAAAARVVAANAEAKGAGPGRLFGMVGTSTGPASAAAPEPPLITQGLPSGRRVSQRHALQQYGSETLGEASVPELLAPPSSSPLLSELRAAVTGLAVRTSYPGVIGGGIGANDGVGGEAAGAGPLAPTPPEPKPAASLRLGRPQPSHRNVLQSDSGSGLRVSAPASPQMARAALSGVSGRLRLGLNASAGGNGGESPAAADGGATSPGGAGQVAATAVGSISGAPSLRARLRLLAVPSAEDDLGSGGGRISSPGGGGGGFSRCLLAPASPGVSTNGTPAQLDSPSHSAQLGHPRFSERSLLAPYGSGNSLDMPGSAGSWAGPAGGPHAADADATSSGDGVPTPPPTGLGRTVSRRRMRRPSSNGDQGGAALDAAASAPPPLQPQRSNETSPEGQSLNPWLPSTSARGGSGDVYPARWFSGSGTVGVGAGGRGGSPLASGSSKPGALSSPMSPPHLGPDPDAPLQPPSSSSLPSHASAPLPALPSPSARSQQQSYQHQHRELHRQHSYQLQRSSSRNCDSGLAPQLEGYIHLGTGPIAEEDSDAEQGPSFDRDDSDPHLLAVPLPSLPPAAALSLPSPRPTSTAALLPSPRPSSGHAHPSGGAASSTSGVSGQVPHRRGAAAGASTVPLASPNASSEPFLELPMAHPGAKDPGIALRRPSCGGGSSSTRARRSSMPNAHDMPPSFQRHHGGNRSHTRPSHSGIVQAADIRPWETPPISPLKARSSSVSGGIAPGGGGSSSVDGGGAAGLAATVLPELQPASGAATTAVRSGSGSSVYAQLVGSRAGGRLSTAGTGATSGTVEEAPSSPITAPEYRLNVGPMPAHRKGDMPVVAVKHTLDI